MCVDDKGNLVYYDFGMMDELKPNVREGFRKFCTALFAGGPTVSDRVLAQNAKKLVDGVEEAGGTREVALIQRLEMTTYLFYGC